jgi:hypothetical protein
MLQGLVVAQATAERLSELLDRREESIMGGPAPQHFPQPFNQLELRTIARQPGQLHMRHSLERCRDQGALVPWRVIDHEHHPRVASDGVGAGDIPHVSRKCRWRASLPGGRLLPRSRVLKRSTRRVVSWPVTTLSAPKT